MSRDLTFSPAEAAVLSGVSPDLQRDWRRRELLPSTQGGRTRFTLEEVAKLYLMNAASVLAPIAKTSDAAEKLGLKLARFAAGEGPAPEGAAAVMPDGAVEVFPTVQAAIDALEAAGSETLRLLVLSALEGPFKMRVRKLLDERYSD